MQRSSARTIGISLLGVLLFGCGVLWAAVEVQKVFFVWWDQFNASQDTAQIPKPNRLSRQLLQTELDPDLREVIAQIELNEKLYKNLEVESVTQKIIQRKQYSLDKKKWCNSWQELVQSILEEGVYDSSGNKIYPIRKVMTKGGGTRYIANGVDPEMIQFIDSKLKTRVIIDRFDSEYKFLVQEAMRREIKIRYPNQCCFPDSDYVFQTSGEMLTMQSVDLSGYQEEDVFKSFESCDGVARYTSHHKDHFQRTVYDARFRIDPKSGAEHLQLFPDILDNIKEYKMMGNNPRTLSTEIDDLTEIKFLGHSYIEGEPVVGLKVVQQKRKGQKIEVEERKYFLAINKNYQVVRTELFDAQSQLPVKLKRVTAWKEFEKGVWFPAEVIETESYNYDSDSSLRLLGMNGNTVPPERKRFAKSVTHHNLKSLNPAYQKEFFAKIPWVQPENYEFSKITDKFIDFVVKNKKREALELTNTETFDLSILEKLLESISHNRTYEVYDYDLHGSLIKHGQRISGGNFTKDQEIGLMAEVRYHGFNRKYTSNPVASVDFILLKKDQDKWVIDSAVVDLRKGSANLFSEKFEKVNNFNFSKGK